MPRTPLLRTKRGRRLSFVFSYDDPQEVVRRRVSALEAFKIDRRRAIPEAGRTRFNPNVKLDPSQVRDMRGKGPGRNPIIGRAAAHFVDKLRLAIPRFTGINARLIDKQDISKFDKTLAEIRGIEPPTIRPVRPKPTRVTLRGAKSPSTRLAPAIRSVKASKPTPRTTTRRLSRNLTRR